MKGWAIAMGIGGMLGAVTILMMPKSNPTRKLAKKTADKMEDVAWKISEKLSDELNDF